jgi:hypothetical protein
MKASPSAFNIAQGNTRDKCCSMLRNGYVITTAIEVHLYRWGHCCDDAYTAAVHSCRSCGVQFFMCIYACMRNETLFDFDSMQHILRKRRVAAMGDAPDVKITLNLRCVK